MPKKKGGPQSGRITKPIDRFEDVVKPHLKTLTDLPSKILYLNEVITQERQEEGLAFDSWGEKSCAEKCELEKKKFMDQLDLELKLRHRPKTQIRRAEEARAKGGTQYQVLLAIHYLLKYAKSDAVNTEKAKFASFVTGFSEHTLRQQWSNIHSRKDQNPHNWERDMTMVRNFFDALGLPELVKLIDNELEM